MLRFRHLVASLLLCLTAGWLPAADGLVIGCLPGLMNAFGQEYQITDCIAVLGLVIGPSTSVKIKILRSLQILNSGINFNAGTYNGLEITIEDSNVGSITWDAGFVCNSCKFTFTGTTINPTTGSMTTSLLSGTLTDSSVLYNDCDLENSPSGAGVGAMTFSIQGMTLRRSSFLVQQSRLVVAKTSGSAFANALRVTGVTLDDHSTLAIEDTQVTMSATTTSTLTIVDVTSTVVQSSSTIRVKNVACTASASSSADLYGVRVASSSSFSSSSNLSITSNTWGLTHSSTGDVAGVIIDPTTTVATASAVVVSGNTISVTAGTSTASSYVFTFPQALLTGNSSIAFASNPLLHLQSTSATAQLVACNLVGLAMTGNSYVSFTTTLVRAIALSTSTGGATALSMSRLTLLDSASPDSVSSKLAVANCTFYARGGATAIAVALDIALSASTVVFDATSFFAQATNTAPVNTVTGLRTGTLAAGSTIELRNCEIQSIGSSPTADAYGVYVNRSVTASSSVTLRGTTVRADAMRTAIAVNIAASTGNPDAVGISYSSTVVVASSTLIATVPTVAASATCHAVLVSAPVVAQSSLQFTDSVLTCTSASTASSTDAVALRVAGTVSDVSSVSLVSTTVAASSTVNSVASTGVFAVHFAATITGSSSIVATGCVFSAACPGANGFAQALRFTAGLDNATSVQLTSTTLSASGKATSGLSFAGPLTVASTTFALTSVSIALSTTAAGTSATGLDIAGGVTMSACSLTAVGLSVYGGNGLTVQAVQLQSTTLTGCTWTFAGMTAALFTSATGGTASLIAHSSSTVSTSSITFASLSAMVTTNGTSTGAASFMSFTNPGDSSYVQSTFVISGGTIHIRSEGGQATFITGLTTRRATFRIYGASASIIGAAASYGLYRAAGTASLQGLRWAWIGGEFYVASSTASAANVAFMGYTTVDDTTSMTFEHAKVRVNGFTFADNFLIDTSAHLSAGSLLLIRAVELECIAYGAACHNIRSGTTTGIKKARIIVTGGVATVTSRRSAIAANLDLNGIAAWRQTFTNVTWNVSLMKAFRNLDLHNKTRTRTKTVTLTCSHTKPLPETPTVSISTTLTLTLTPSTTASTTLSYTGTVSKTGSSTATGRTLRLAALR
jgi:hypothetical protein